MSGWQYRIYDHPLQFATVARTSRNELTHRPTWILELRHPDFEKPGYGEFGIIAGLSPEDREGFFHEADLALLKLCQILPAPSMPFSKLDWLFAIHKNLPEDMPSVNFAVEMALLDLLGGGDQILYPSDFTKGNKSININGLIWIDAIDKMRQEIKTKELKGFKTIKLKISDAGFDQEFALMNDVRKSVGTKLTFRVDANEAFTLKRAREVMNDLYAFGVHSIEQPIRRGKWDQMASLCKNHPLPVALDEELIGVAPARHEELISSIMPQYLILKPSLHGGLYGCYNWIRLAKKYNVGWWMTSALESNLGLNAIAQFLATQDNDLPQGLGTGQLYTNNIQSPLYLDGPNLGFDPTKSFDFAPFVNEQELVG